MSNEQLTFVLGAISVLLVYFTNRSSASNGITSTAFQALTTTIQTLRTELDAEKKSREDDAKKMSTIVDDLKKSHEKEMKAMEKYFEELFEVERRRYTVYIKKLLLQLKAANIAPVEWDSSD